MKKTKLKISDLKQQAKYFQTPNNADFNTAELSDLKKISKLIDKITG